MTLYYNPSIPLPKEIPSENQEDFLKNFRALNIYYGVDHIPFGNSIEAATTASPIVITSTDHRLSTGNTATVYSLKGINSQGVVSDWVINGSPFVVTVIDANTFSLNGSNGTTYDEYVPNSGDFKSNSINYGFHLKNFFPDPLSTLPVRNAPSSSYYPKLDEDSITQLFYQNGDAESDSVQLTNLPTTASVAGNGFETPWGIIVNFGPVTVNKPNFTTFTYPIPFTSKVYSLNIMTQNFVVFSFISNPIIQEVSLTQFRTRLESSSSQNFSNIPAFYIAIGV